MRPETLAQRLERLLRDRQYGKPQKKIAAEAGIDLQTLRNVLDGSTTNPRYETLVKLASYLRVSYEYLQTGEGEPDLPAATMPEIRARVDEAIAILQDISRQLEAS